MCSTVGKRGSPDEEWDALLRASADLPFILRQWIEQAREDVREDTIQKLARPLDKETDYTRISGLAEWSILRDLMDTEWLQNRVDSETSQRFHIAMRAIGGKPSTQEKETRSLAQGVSELASLWVHLMDKLGEYSTSEDVPRTMLKTLSKMKRLAGGVTVGLREYEYLIRGHGHRPYADSRSMVADAGCWLGTQGAYLEIGEGKVRQRRWTLPERS